jgi:hypothetical protein
MQDSFKSIHEDPSKNSVIWVWHVDNVKSDYSVRGFLGVPTDTGSVMAPTGLIFFPAKAVEGLRRFCELLSVKTHFVEGW